MNNDKQVFNSILTGLNQALEYEKGLLPSVKRRTVTISQLPTYKAEKIKSIRNTLN